MFWHCAVYLAGIGLASNAVALYLPRRWFRPDHFPYRLYRWEQRGKVYEKLHIQAWKDHMPDVSRYYKKMTRKEITPETATSAYLTCLVQETCVAECIHYCLALLSSGCCFLLSGWLLWLLLILYNLLGNVPFIIIQRYNRPRLMEVARALVRREMLEAASAAGRTEDL